MGEEAMEARVLAGASRFWRRRFVRVAEARRAANVTLRLVEAPAGGERSWWLRLCRHPGTGSAGLDFELRVLRAVDCGAGVEVALPVAGRGGRLRTRLGWDGVMRHACLFAHAEGREMLPCAEDLRRFGRAVAELHGALQAVGGVAGRRIEAGEACAAAAFWLRRAGQAAIAEQAERAGPVLRAAVAAAGPGVGLCHGDAWLGNARLDGERVTFFDFEDCAVGPLALDLATMARWLRREADGAELWEALLAGYSEGRALSGGDLAAMPALAEVRGAGDLARFWGMDAGDVARGGGVGAKAGGGGWGGGMMP